MAKKTQELQPEAIEPVDEATEKAKKEAKHEISKITATLMTRPSFMAAHTAMSFIPDSMKAYGPANIMTMHEEYRDRC
jgi:hypothetical protein